MENRIVVITMEQEEMVMFEQMMAQEEVVWTNHYGLVRSTFTKYNMSHAILFHLPLSFFVVFIGHHG